MGLSNGETRRQLTDGLVVRDCRACGGTNRCCEVCGGTGQIVIRAPDVDPWRTHDPAR